MLTTDRIVTKVWKTYNSRSRDIDFALSSGYPEQLKYKLHERKTKCYIVLNDFDKARTALNVAKKSFEAHKLKMDEKKLAQTKKTLQELNEAINKKSQLKGESIIPDENPTPVIPKLTQGTNKKMRNLSNLVKVQYKVGLFELSVLCTCL